MPETSAKTASRMRRLIAVFLTACILSACSLLPAEEPYRASPVIRDFEHNDWRFAYAKRGDVVLTRLISATYMPVRHDTLSFSADGLAFDGIYVNVGDAVTEGEVLASLVMDDLREQLRAEQNNTLRLTLSLEELEALRGIDLRRAELTGNDAETVNARYDRRKSALGYDLEISSLRIEELQKKISDRQLIAPFSGTVTYVRKLQSGGRSISGERILTISDSTLSAFRIQTPYWPEFTPGSRFTIRIGQDNYTTCVVSAAELGLPEPERKEGMSSDIYLVIEDAGVTLSENTLGTLVMEVDSRTDVLTVPSSAVFTINGASAVYIQDENGFKTSKYIETGLDDGKNIEVISGLSEGDPVIVE